jgi:hypothetical protein
VVIFVEREEGMDVHILVQILAILDLVHLALQWDQLVLAVVEE